MHPNTLQAMTKVELLDDLVDTLRENNQPDVEVKVEWVVQWLRIQRQQIIKLYKEDKEVNEWDKKGFNY